MKKFSISIILVMVMCLVLGVTSLASDDIYREKVPRVIIEETENITEVVAGETLNITVKYTNDSEHNAYELRLTPIFDDMPFVYERPVVFEREKALRARTTDTASFSFKIADDAKIGVYGLKFKLEYSNLRDENYENEQTVYFKVSKEKIKPIITISDIVAGEGNVIAGREFPLSFTINNNGEVDASNVEVYLKGLNEKGFMAVDSNDYKYIGRLENGANMKVNFDMFASEYIAKGTNTLSLEIKYKDTTDNELSTEKTIYILDVKSENEVVDEGDTTSAKPKIIISSYSTNPTSLTAGGIFDFTFTFKNTSKEKRLRNMKVTLSSTDGAFIITKGSNTFSIEEMAPNADVTKSIELKSKQDLTSNSYPIIISFEYEDFNGNEYNATETINIPITEYSKLVINYVYAMEAYVGSNTSLSFDYINMGKATISNLTASVEGDYTSVQPINYIGNLATGTSDYYDIEITPTKSGTNYGTLVLAFEDSSGAIVEVRKDFEGFAMEMPTYDEPSFDEPMYDDPGMIMPEPEETIETWVIVVSGIGSFLVSFIITKMITTKIVRKRLEDEI